MFNVTAAAQSVWCAYEQILENECVLTETDVKALAATLRAAGDTLSHPASAHTLYAIADELEGVKHGTYRCSLEDKPQ